MNVRETWWEGVDWMHLALDRDQWLVVNTVMNLCREFDWMNDC